jgi:ketosteroid isomerase-like protein
MRRVGLMQGTEADIAANSERFSAAMSTGDCARAAAVYGEDAVLLPPTGDVIRGRPAIERFWRSGVEIGLHAVEFERFGRGGTGSVVYEHGRYRIAITRVDGRAQVERGPYVVVHVQADENGSWHWAVNVFGGAAT